ncbi:TadE/TadG family type IV pilus assembly protein [Sphingomonas sp. URHD0057]|uniref:TadE/TadG family type IV pilus assembly protein n=1 Tax=Sphingomonas sp. URHD0057 TaxID=1380389 RepID=UPI000569EB10|nr:TadE/TadG family type IV pilus assembly protein [Sphingomonas sp. URHD0057]
MSKLFQLRRDERGAGAVEFALSVPILITLIYGIFEFSQLYEANAGMQHALGEGARFATLCVPTGTGCNAETDDDIKAKMNAKLFGPVGGVFTVQDVVDGTSSKTLTVTYTRTMNFLFFTGPAITLTRSKLVYTPSAT